MLGIHSRNGIREAIQTMAAVGMEGKTPAIFNAEVTAVDIATRTCTVVSSSLGADTEFANVQLMAESADGLLYVPKVGSAVLVADPKVLDPYVLLWSELDQILYVIGNTSFKVVDGLTTFNGGELGGLLKIVPTLSAINAMQNDINKLKVDLLALNATLTALGGTPITGTAWSGAFTGAQLATYGAQLLTVTTRSDIEDTKVKH